MDELFDWPPILWAGRLLLLGTLVSGGWIGFLYACRYFRWSNMKAIASGTVPKIKSLQVLGQNIELHNERAVEADRLLRDLGERLSDVEKKHEQLYEAFHGRMRGE